MFRIAQLFPPPKRSNRLSEGDSYGTDDLDDANTTRARTNNNGEPTQLIQLRVGRVKRVALE